MVELPEKSDHHAQIGKICIQIGEADNITSRYKKQSTSNNGALHHPLFNHLFNIMSYEQLLVLPRHTKTLPLHHSSNNNKTTSLLSSTTHMWSINSTPTMYDTSTSQYLIRMFFDTCGRDRKLTKDQRNEIIKRTGLTSRRITYWFSNHKRRFKNEIKTYRHLLEQGTITTYDEFVEFLRDNRLPKIRI